ncbi:MAG: glycosyltransferase family 4 protein [Sulfurimonas sp.]|nr:glycosyltransferase family 4 protein [Sulfurimonas sp.]
MNKKNFLIVTEYFYPSKTTTSYYLTEIAKKLADDSLIKVICNNTLQNSEELKNKNLTIIRVKENKLSKNIFVLRFVKLIISSIKLSYYTYRNLKKDTYIFAVTNPSFIILILAIFKKFKTFKYVLLVYDVFPENLLAAGIIKNKNSLIYKSIKKVFDYAYMSADELIVIGRDMEEVVSSKVKQKVPITLIENWCDYEKIIPQKKNDNKIIKNFNLNEKKVFLFAGNLGRVQGIETLIKAAELVKDEKFRLLFIGDGAMREKIQNHILTTLNSKIVYGGNFSQDEQDTFLNASDISISSLAKEMYGLGVPSKSYYNMAAAKPLLYIGEDKSEIAMVIKEHKIGWICEPENVAALVVSFEEICKNFSKLEDYGKRARIIVEKYYSKEIILNKYNELFKKEFSR